MHGSGVVGVLMWSFKSSRNDTVPLAIDLSTCSLSLPFPRQVWQQHESSTA